MSSTPEHRSGFASFVGRPNAGKSTLTNALVGSKVVITSSKPQTTRQRNSKRSASARPNMPTMRRRSAPMSANAPRC